MYKIIFQSICRTIDKMKAPYIVVLCLFYFVKCQEKNCVNKETCSDCIQTLGCIWCSQPRALNGSLPIYCRNENLQDELAWCPTNKLNTPEEKFNIEKDDPLKSQTDGVAVQIKPQRVKLTLRKDKEFKLQFEYRQAENYPVDLYYIMDLSKSMSPHKNKLALLGGKLAAAMRNLTNNFRLGFGSFVDKTDMPFISTVPRYLEIPCTYNKDGQTVNCVPPYSFINHMSLTEDSAAFSDEVDKAEVSGNLDYPEGGLDAVMQAMVCKNVIGWRDKARHMIVYSTDADFHIAGDGKLAGVVEPNDAKCHMKDNKYTHDLIYDYPSISQINYVAKQNNINLILAIVVPKGDNRILSVYKRLHERIDNSAVEALDQNSENVVSLVSEKYNEIVDSVVLTDDSGNEVEIKYSSNCRKPRENGCTDIHVGEVIKFTASIRPLRCPLLGSKPQIIKIKPEGIDESLEIELEVICDCLCERPNNTDFVANSQTCNYEGDLECGICKCKSGRYGRNCECDGLTSNSNDVSSCKVHENDTEVCSGVGSCKCGKCECQSREDSRVISGKFCECNNYSCQRKDNRICNNNGNCECGKCKCSAGWSGDVCDCPISNSLCIDPESQKVCNGNGDCSCGYCSCNVIDGYKRSGKYCQECLTCPVDISCEDLQFCSKCKEYDSKKLYEENNCNITCTSFELRYVSEDVENNNLQDNKICKGPQGSQCDEIIFKYSYDDKKKIIVVSEKCGKTVDVIAVVLWVIGSIVLAGIILLVIWKIFTVVHDRREYAKFEQERANAKWHGGGNPLYKKATSEFKNPLYPGGDL